MHKKDTSHASPILALLIKRSFRHFAHLRRGFARVDTAKRPETRAFTEFLKVARCMFEIMHACITFTILADRHPASVRPVSLPSRQFVKYKWLSTRNFRVKASSADDELGGSGECCSEGKMCVG